MKVGKKRLFGESDGGGGDERQIRLLLTEKEIGRYGAGKEQSESSGREKGRGNNPLKTNGKRY